MIKKECIILYLLNLESLPKLLSSPRSIKFLGKDRWLYLTTNKKKLIENFQMNFNCLNTMFCSICQLSVATYAFGPLAI